jgi:carbon monoxide dehydrogenase subunit G
VDLPRRRAWASTLQTIGFMNRRQVLLTMVSATFAAMVPSTAFAQTSPRWWRDTTDPRWVHGDVTVAAPSDAVWRRLRRVTEWPRTFTDIKSLRVLESGQDEWLLKITSRTFDYGAYEYRAQFTDATRSARGSFGGAGATAVCTMRVAEGGEPQTSRVWCSLFIDARGVAAWVLGQEEIRRRQEHMVVQYLQDFEHAFAPRAT